MQGCTQLYRSELFKFKLKLKRSVAWKELVYSAILNINLCIQKMISKGYEVVRIPTTTSRNERWIVKSSAECFGC